MRPAKTRRQQHGKRKGTHPKPKPVDPRTRATKRLAQAKRANPTPANLERIARLTKELGGTP